MKRIVLTGAAVAALFTVGIPAAAMAATSAPKSKKTTTTTKTVATHVSCKLSLTTVAAPGSSGVEPGSTTGTNFGNSSCTTMKPGVARQTFSIDPAGDMTGKIQSWFATGSLYGTYDLSEGTSAPPTTGSFGKTSFSGTIKLTGASGELKGVTGTGTMACYTPDSLHYTCIAKITLSQQVTVTTTTTKKSTSKKAA